MSEKSSSSALVEVVDAFPYAGKALGAMARLALKQSEQEAIGSCLERALVPTDAKVGGRGVVKLILHPRKSWAARSGRRQAARDAIAVDALFAPSEDDDRGPATVDPDPRMPVSNDDEDEALWDVRELASNQLKRALAVEEFVPWTDRLAGILTINAEAHWEHLARRFTPARREEMDRFWGLVANDPTPASDSDRTKPPAKPSDSDFIAFGERVGLRFVANMAVHDQLQILVRRLDRQDSQRAEAALVAATQGLRVALLTVAVMLGFATAALVDIAAG